MFRQDQASNLSQKKKKKNRKKERKKEREKDCSKLTKPQTIRRAEWRFRDILLQSFLNQHSPFNANISLSSLCNCTHLWGALTLWAHRIEQDFDACGLWEVEGMPALLHKKPQTRRYPVPPGILKHHSRNTRAKAKVTDSDKKQICFFLCWRIFNAVRVQYC